MKRTRQQKAARRLKYQVPTKVGERVYSTLNPRKRGVIVHVHVRQGVTRIVVKWNDDGTESNFHFTNAREMLTSQPKVRLYVRA